MILLTYNKLHNGKYNLTVDKYKQKFSQMQIVLRIHFGCFVVDIFFFSFACNMFVRICVIKIQVYMQRRIVLVYVFVAHAEIRNGIGQVGQVEVLEQLYELHCVLRKKYLHDRFSLFFSTNEQKIESLPQRRRERKCKKPIIERFFKKY